MSVRMIITTSESPMDLVPKHVRTLTGGFDDAPPINPGAPEVLPAHRGVSHRRNAANYNASYRTGDQRPRSQGQCCPACRRGHALLEELLLG